MKKRIIYLFFISSLLACGGNDNGEQTVLDSPTCTMIFMDKSVSVNVNKKFINEKYTKVINDLIEQHVNKKGDKVDVFFIHENTGQGKALEITCQTEMGDQSSANATDSEAIKTEYDMSIQKERAIFRQQILKKLQTQNASSSKNNTDIWATLPIIDKKVAQGFNVKVYYLSDMVESMRAPNRRDFHVNPPDDDAAAVGWAREDVLKFKNDLPNIRNAQIFIVKPFEPTATTRQNSPSIAIYWQRLFMELGVSGEVVEL
jgi:hypothetical protein